MIHQLDVIIIVLPLNEHYEKIKAKWEDSAVLLRKVGNEYICSRCRKFMCLREKTGRETSLEWRVATEGTISYCKAIWHK